MLSVFLLFVQLSVSLVSAATIKGQLQLGFANITNSAIARTHFNLYELSEPLNGKTAYKDVAKLRDLEGNFEFQNVPINETINATTYFVIYPYSKDFNLKPNRILIEFSQNDNGTITQKAFKNYFGREYFPSEEIQYPDSLDETPTEPFIKVSVVNKAPFRQYLQIRNEGFFKSGPLAGLFDSRWKVAGIITLLAVVIFPFLVEKFDPATVQAMKEESLKRQKEKYQTN